MKRNKPRLHIPKTMDSNRADVSQMVQKIENLMEELILKKENNFKLKMLLKTINVVSSGVSTDIAAASAD
ncbi:hypothetical protein POTOM_018002 [Populus tomentosa]|uniref:Uncharacterized protein n=1 Tax=Populus tomentosa TaxID=118781 RepID=A0A8X8ABS9_POPTO|nr:hypothetical protein POTOM_018002 [Populus tomentosa]